MESNTNNNMIKLSFSESFQPTFEKFKKGAKEYEEVSSLETRFNIFKTKFESAFSHSLYEEKDDKNAGIYETTILCPLYEDCKELMIKLLESHGFHEVEDNLLKKPLDFYFKSVKNTSQVTGGGPYHTIFRVMKYIPINPRIY